MIGSFAGSIVVIVEALAMTWPPLTPACARSGPDRAQIGRPDPPHCRGAPG
jgi:hypothetical protein